MFNSPSLSNAGLICIAIVAGALVPFQAGSNAALSRALGHPLWASLASLVVSILVVLPALFALRVPVPSIGQAAQASAWLWLGGVAGVIYITSALVLMPQLGATTFIVSVIAGQVLASLLIDNYGLMGFAVKPANVGRIAGVLLIFVGMMLIQWFTSTPAPTSQSQAAILGLPAKVA
ncbi:DMT family transporter [Paraburkholderia fungorum]|uniref:DMT family transporter n=1 Tax=Paraburkholderia fungorum TaxID=134537 RepID=UPI00402B396A